MSITPEQSQRVTDQRTRMLANIAAGRPAWEGFTKEELRDSLEILQAGRARAATAATKARKGKKGEAPVSEDFFKTLGLE